MKKASVEKTFSQYIYWLVWYTEFLNKVYSAEHIVKTKEEKEEVVEAFLLRVHSLWEGFTEDLLIDCLNRDASMYAKYTGLKLPKHMTRPQCTALLLGLGYFDTRSVAELRRLAKNILVAKNNPFKAIPSDAAATIDDFSKIRNYAAHESLAAERTLMTMYKTRHNMKTFRYPGNFLLAWDKRTNQTRFGNYVDAFLEATTAMAKSLGLKM